MLTALVIQYNNKNQDQLSTTSMEHLQTLIRSRSLIRSILSKYKVIVNLYLEKLMHASWEKIKKFVKGEPV